MDRNNILTSSQEGKMAEKYINTQSDDEQAEYRKVMDGISMLNGGSRGSNPLPLSEIEIKSKADRGFERSRINPENAALEHCTCGHMTHKKDAALSDDLGEYYVSRMVEALEEWYSKPRDGYHVTDVVMCPRQRVFREIDRRPIDAKTVSIYSSGKAIHEAIQLLFRSDKRTFEIEKFIEFEDILGSVDLYDRKRNIPLEFKTCRSNDLREPKRFHIEQLKYYMAILDTQEGYIVYQFLLHFGERPLKTFRIMMNTHERKEQRYKLVKEINSLKEAIQARDPSLARSVSDDQSLNWLCKECPYLLDCKKIQNISAAS